jgi:site-specific recombinase XerD
METILKKFIKKRNLKKSTASLYKSALADYSKFQQMSLKRLIEEADNEEEERIREKRRKIKERLEKYRNYKVDSGSATGTVKKYFEVVKTFYRHHEIVIPYIPTIQLKKDYHEKYEDIPKIEHIEKAINSTDNLREKAVILFMSSSGTARNETIHLKIEDFIKATKDYHNNGSLNDILDELILQENIIPLFELVRIKTDYHYYTCCSNEATDMIIKYLKTRKNLRLDSSLFDINRNALNRFFFKINNENNWGKVGYYGFFRSHALRKFHATVIEDKSLADALQGRKRDSITESYYKLNPERIRERYIEVLDQLTINQTFEKTDKYELLMNENKILHKRLNKLEKILVNLTNNNI